MRHAVQAYLSGANLKGVGTVFASPPKVARSSDAYANLPAGTASGSVVFVEIMTAREKRLGLGGPTQGVKETRYTLRLHVLFRSRQGKATDAMDDHDDMIEAILTALRADRTLGTASGQNPISQYGQDGIGISITTGLPKESGTGSVHIWTLIDGDLVETINA